jgi:hypothetical protein
MVNSLLQDKSCGQAAEILVDKMSVNDVPPNQGEQLKVVGAEHIQIS